LGREYGVEDATGRDRERYQKGGNMTEQSAMNPERQTRGDASAVWPALPYDTWKPTLDTVHMWTQIVGKVKLELNPFLNQWWEVAFFVTARGLTTSTIPFGPRVFEVNFDFVDHRLDIHVADGTSASLSLSPRSVAAFYKEFMGALDSLGIRVEITTSPQEVENTIPFDQDDVHASYDAEYVNRFWRILVQTERLLQQYRTPFVGKSSPILFWWGSFDLSEFRYSGRKAPEREWPKRWMALGAGEEQSGAGFWPGNEKVPEPAFFAYTYPESPGCRVARIQPAAAFFQPDVAEFVLPYEKTRQAEDPDQVIMDFFTSTYEAGATLAGWKRADLEQPDPLRRHQAGS